MKWKLSQQEVETGLRGKSLFTNNQVIPAGANIEIEKGQLPEYYIFLQVLEALQIGKNLDTVHSKLHRKEKERKKQKRKERERQKRTCKILNKLQNQKKNFQESTAQQK